MPRWRALPDELDPQVREFASQLRRLVDRSGLSIASVADRTGYSKTSWERYLNGRLLAPKGAIVALAEVTGTNPIHLTTMWELAERAWSRSEMRHDMTMEAIRISQARAALGEFGAPPANAKGGTTARRSGSATATPGIAGPAGVAPTVPPQPRAPDAQDSAGSAPAAPADSPASSPARSPASPAGSSSGANSWGVAGYRGPAQSAARPPGAATPTPKPTPAPGPVADGPGWTPGTPSPFGEPPQGPRPGGNSSSGGGRRRLTMFLAGVVGVLVVIAAVFYLTDKGSDKKNEGGGSPSPSVSAQTDLPAGVKCSGASCTGKDAEAMGCTKDTAAVTTAKTAVVGTTTVEVRYSKTCGAAWGRITQAAQGDSVQVTAGSAKQDDSITVAGDNIAYTPMVAVKDAGEAKACATLASGQKGCTQ
ncbi:XRE family transcriptional regulator [Streptomyces sp. NBC_00183]|uniref:helix-turn-helix domain-containing protein n=1 Tax=unclassified Streptomyces TaxID=2593676 RepID=UPI00225ACF5A|nr:XRE family transcriptional regulator [Streptomyces sp. NBC_00183]MCX5293448.1 XRE family transcriptional regulator [Streptomyces sp. NBC_00183]